MADTTTRTLKLLALLQAHRLWGAAELAERLETTERTVRRDVDRLRELGYPVASTRGAGGGYQLAPGGSLPPLVVDEGEAVAIVTALRNAASGPAAGLAEQSLRALAKVTQVLPPRLRKRADAVSAMSESLPGAVAPPAPPLEPEELTTVALACRDAAELTFDYAPADRSGRMPGRRRVEPLRLVPVGRRWYLLAYDLDRHDWRTFRMDRLRAARPEKRRFAPRAVPGGDAAEFVRRNLRVGREQHLVRILVHADETTVTPRIGRWARIEAHDDATLVSIEVDDTMWIAALLARLDAEYEFVELPEEILHALRARNARESRALYLATRDRADGDVRR